VLIGLVSFDVLSSLCDICRRPQMLCSVYQLDVNAQGLQSKPKK